MSDDQEAHFLLHVIVAAFIVAIIILMAIDSHNSRGKIEDLATRIEALETAP